jgi:hypothetical protein
VLHSASINIPDPGFVGDLERWWTEARKRIRKQDRRRFDSMIINTSWTLWKQRNARSFGNEREQRNLHQMLAEIKG